MLCYCLSTTLHSTPCFLTVLIIWFWSVYAPIFLWTHYGVSLLSPFLPWASSYCTFLCLLLCFVLCFILLLVSVFIAFTCFLFVLFCFFCFGTCFLFLFSFNLLANALVGFVFCIALLVAPCLLLST